MRQEHIAAIVLAGGLSSRMGGGDKGMRVLGGGSMLGHVVKRLAPQAGPMALNANGDATRFASFGLPVIADTVADFPGPLAGILAGMEWAAERGCQAIVTAAGDTPFLPKNLVERLSAAAAGRKDAIAVACSFGVRHPVFAFWPVALQASLRHFLIDRGNRRVASFIDGHAHVEVDFPILEEGGVSIDPFFNINTPDDLAEAERLLKGLDA